VASIYLIDEIVTYDSRVSQAILMKSSKLNAADIVAA
jgi:hypothetical protein